MVLALRPTTFTSATMYKEVDRPALGHHSRRNRNRPPNHCPKTLNSYQLFTNQRHDAPTLPARHHDARAARGRLLLGSLHRRDHTLYAYQLRRWFTWCETNGLDPLVGCNGLNLSSRSAICTTAGCWTITFAVRAE